MARHESKTSRTSIRVALLWTLSLYTVSHAVGGAAATMGINLHSARDWTGNFFFAAAASRASADRQVFDSVRD